MCPGTSKSQDTNSNSHIPLAFTNYLSILKNCLHGFWVGFVWFRLVLGFWLGLGGCLFGWFDLVWGLCFRLSWLSSPNWEFPLLPTPKKATNCILRHKTRTESSFNSSSRQLVHWRVYCGIIQLRRLIRIQDQELQSAS